VNFWVFAKLGSKDVKSHGTEYSRAKHFDARTTYQHDTCYNLGYLKPLSDRDKQSSCFMLPHSMRDTHSLLEETRINAPVVSSLVASQ
jgi:hypothetical protein